MFKIMKLAVANIRKTKGNTISLFVMFVLAALLLNAGLLIVLNFGNYFNNTVEDLKTTNIYYLMPANRYTAEVEAVFAEDSNVLELQKEEALMGSGFLTFNGKTQEKALLFFDADQPRERSQWKFVGKHLPPENMSIYLPYIFNRSSGYQLNDPIEITCQDIKFTFVIKGFTEDVLFSSNETGALGTYLPHDTYVKVASQLDEAYDFSLVFVNLAEVNKDIETEIKQITGLESVSFSSNIANILLSFDLEIIQTSRTMMAIMMAVVIVVFAAIIVIVCLMVVRFRIGNSIEDDMTKIGSLKAIGYTSRQIVFSVVMQFLLIAFAGNIIGIGLSYLTPPLVSDIFAQQSGLRWEQGFDGGISTFSLLFILMVVLMVSYITARRINRLNPIVALRGGIITHSFRKNHMQLSTAIGSLPVVLALKSLLQNKKQGIMIIIIMLAISFTGTFAVVMFYNTTVDTRTFNETPGVELSNATALLKPGLDHTELIEEIRNMEEVRKVQFIDDGMVTINKNEVRLFIMEDFSEKETDTIYKGRYPKHSNEIAIAGYMAEIIGKKVGDKIEVSMGDKSVEYLITGLTQGAFMGGMNASLQLDGFLKLNPEFKQSNLQIYLNKGEPSESFVKKLNGLYPDAFLVTTDMDKAFKEGAGVYTAIVSKVGITIFIASMAVVVLVLFFVINSSVTRRKREIGIQKAIGFTTLQLMNQISLGFLFPVSIGVCIGNTLGILRINAVMTTVQRGMGIMKATYIITPGWIASFGLGVVIVAYLTSMLVTYRIRKISAYALVSE